MYVHYEWGQCPHSASRPFIHAVGLFMDGFACAGEYYKLKFIFFNNRKHSYRKYTYNRIGCWEIYFYWWQLREIVSYTHGGSDIVVSFKAHPADESVLKGNGHRAASDCHLYPQRKDMWVIVSVLVGNLGCANYNDSIASRRSFIRVAVGH